MEHMHRENEWITIDENGLLQSKNINGFDAELIQNISITLNYRGTAPIHI